jgi:CheY-like chemotaxis protein
MAGTPAKLLIVDDEPLLRESMMHVLTEIGYRVRVAEDGFSALREIREQMPDFLVSDLNMPGMSGFELLAVVRRRFPAIRSIAMSGAFSGNEVPSGVAADAYYAKGSSIGALRQIMGTLGQTQQRAALPANSARTVWIQHSKNSLAGEGCMTIGCPECLRTFPLAYGSSINKIRETICFYCGNPIQYAIVEPLERAAFETARKAPAKQLLVSSRAPAARAQ